MIKAKLPIASLLIGTFFILATSSILCLSKSAHADGTESLGSPSIPIAAGTGIRAAGIGLENHLSGTITITIPDAVTVEQVILYWGGNNHDHSQLTLTDTINVEGADVTGNFIGGDTWYANGKITVSYRADITSLGLVTSGTSSFTVNGVYFPDETYGAGVLVIYDDGSAESQVDIRDGNDFAMIDWPIPLDATELQTFNFTASNADRIGSVELFVGSVYSSYFRPSSFEITTGGTTAVFSDQLNSNDGKFWDTVNLVVTIPAGATSLSAQIFSRDDGIFAPGNLPASLVWMASGFSVETPSPDSCWITTGGFQNAGKSSGTKDYTFGGNVGPPPRGSWEVVDHNTGDNFHSNEVHIVSCDVINLTGPGQPGGKKGFKINQASFEGVGRLNHKDGYIFTGYVQDAGEPHGKKGNDQDFFSITVRDPGTLEIVFEASATLDGGNVQIHPPTGKYKK
ncbi:MAG: hypothetical protein DIZ80_08090 [endosymbiont of Galathealinum brachiosum]|uniref:Uncharacterized protein n=1 Tax=endosymbiont of Galathealinum brachiosum TaxID=2200906 RepID=A0A370DGW5_9GAMM|nr:MAG: hypothetical protein DIZ80_08090 [endosymbiont of Galathealinum brachiosum]